MTATAKRYHISYSEYMRRKLASPSLLGVAMRFEDLPQTEREALAAYGYEIAAEMEAAEAPRPGDPTLDPRYDPSRELRRLNYQRRALEREIEGVTVGRA